MSRRWRTALVALPLLLGIAACGDDDDGDEQDAAACDAYLDVVSAFNEEPDPEVIDPLLDTLEAEKPDAVDSELQYMVDAVRDAFESGEMDFFEDPEFTSATQTVDQHFYDGCEAEEKIEVEAVDYAFTGFPEELPAGLSFVKLTNATTKGESHEIAVLSKNDGVTDSWDELLASEEESAEKVTFHGAGFADGEGDTAVAFLDLDAGEYIAVCFISVGGEEDGPPHFTEGMRHEFTVA